MGEVPWILSKGRDLRQYQGRDLRQNGRDLRQLWKIQEGQIDKASPNTHAMIAVDDEKTIIFQCYVENFWGRDLRQLWLQSHLMIVSTCTLSMIYWQEVAPYEYSSSW